MTTAFQPALRFGLTSPAPKTDAKPIPKLVIDPAFKQSFLESMDALAQPSGLSGNPNNQSKSVFTRLWAENPNQAVTLFGDVMSKVASKLGSSAIGQKLTQFLRFARCEFGFLNSDEITTRFEKEFQDLVKREHLETKTAEHYGVDPQFGFLRQLFGGTLEQSGVRDKMLAAIAEAQK